MSTPNDEEFHVRCARMMGNVTPAQVAELIKDKARLDWLESECHTITWTGSTPTIVRGEDGLEFQADTFRAAIDAAIEATP